MCTRLHIAATTVSQLGSDRCVLNRQLRTSVFVAPRQHLHRPAAGRGGGAGQLKVAADQVLQVLRDHVKGQAQLEGRRQRRCRHLLRQAQRWSDGGVLGSESSCA